MKKTLQDYKSPFKPVWCPGCGNYGVLNALIQALQELEIPPENVVFVTGIGCSGRISHYVKTYSLHGTHGRVLPTALGAKAARPDLTVLAAGGDGDGLGIGGGHIPHAARKNSDINYLLVDNQIYGLTKGQSSPTTPIDFQTKTSPYGGIEEPMDPIPVFLAYDVSFVARSCSFTPAQLKDIIKKGIAHKGMSLLYVYSPCQAYPVIDIKDLKALFKPLPKNYPRNDKMKAMEMAYARDRLYTGIFYQINRPTLEDLLEVQIKAALKEEKEKQPLSVPALLKRFT